MEVGLQGEMTADATIVKRVLHRVKNTPTRKSLPESACEGTWGDNGKLVFNGHRVSVWSKEKVLKMNSGDGYTIL